MPGRRRCGRGETCGYFFNRGLTQRGEAATEGVLTQRRGGAEEEKIFAKKQEIRKMQCSAAKPEPKGF
jgi:hypothetical protein